MSDRLFKRVARVTAYRARPGVPGGFVSSNPQFFDTLPNAIVVNDARIEFSIEKSTDSDPNTCEVKITNCNETTRTDLVRKPLIVRIEAGYDGNLRHLYTGDLRYGENTHEDTEWITALQLGDGDRATRYARVNRSYAKGSNVITAVRECAKSMGLDVDAKTLASAELQAAFASGRAITGDAAAELTRLLAEYGFHWSIQDGRMQILRDNDTRPDQAHIISVDTGMIGSPSFGAPDKSGKPQPLHVKSLLYPELTPGGKIDVRSRKVNGIFRIERVTHTGATEDDADWFSEIEARAV